LDPKPDPGFDPGFDPSPDSGSRRQTASWIKMSERGPETTHASRTTLPDTVSAAKANTPAVGPVARVGVRDRLWVRVGVGVWDQVRVGVRVGVGVGVRVLVGIRVGARDGVWVRDRVCVGVGVRVWVWVWVWVMVAIGAVDRLCVRVLD
jgi:hypothetical protein